MEGILCRGYDKYRCVPVPCLVIAALSELSFLSLVLEPLQFLLTVGRFGGLVWLIAAGFLLPRRRAAANQEGRTQRVAPR